MTPNRTIYFLFFRCLMLLSLIGLVQGCASPAGSGNREEESKKASVEMCLTYMPQPGPEYKNSLGDICRKYATDIRVEFNKNPDSLKVSAFSATWFIKFCLDGVPDDVKFCEKLSRELQDDVEDLSITTNRDGGGFLDGVLVLTKGCLLMADHIFGFAPEMGYCRRGTFGGLFSAVSAGDADNFQDWGEEIKRQFPIGTPIASLVEFLTTHGFSCRTDAAERQCVGDTGFIAFRGRRYGGFGDFTIHVQWSADSEARIDRLDVVAIGAGL